VVVAFGARTAARQQPRPQPRPPEPLTESSEPDSIAPVANEHLDEPPLPDEKRAEVRSAQAAPTLPVEAPPGHSLQIRFRLAPQDELVSAFEAIKEVIHGHPGVTPVVLRLPVGNGREQRMQLRVGVAYDAELLSSLRRRVGDQLLEVTLLIDP
jgi:hypothetical protein